METVNPELPEIDPTTDRFKPHPDFERTWNGKALRHKPTGMLYCGTLDGRQFWVAPQEESVKRARAHACPDCSGMGGCSYGLCTNEK